MRIVIADDHTLVRAGVRRLVDSFGGFQVVAEAQTGAEALDLIRLHRPELVLLDLSMPVKGGFEVMAEMRQSGVSTLPVVLSMYSDVGRVRQALDLGARGYVVKDAAVGELELAMRAAAAGRVFLSPQVSGAMVNNMLNPERGAGVDALSPRQRDILMRLGRGESIKEIAAALGISNKTVETHRSRMMITLGCRRSAELLRFALRYVEAWT